MELYNKRKNTKKKLVYQLVWVCLKGMTQIKTIIKEASSQKKITIMIITI